MNLSESQKERLAFLARVVMKELQHLLLTDGRLFSREFNEETVKFLETDVDLAEQLDAFVSRFGRLQDTAGDKVLPALLSAIGEPVGPVIDNLDKAERFGWITSADDWLAIRRLRNEMVHEYIEDPVILADAVNTGHRLVPTLKNVVNNLIQEIDRRKLTDNHS